MIKELFPDFLKPLMKFFIFHHERKRFFSELKIKRIQNQMIKDFDEKSSSLIVFLIPGLDNETRSEKISGGIMSIVSLYEETKKLKSIHNSETVLVTFPQERLLLRHEKFANDSIVLRYEQLPFYFKNTESLLVHVPEFLCEHLLMQIEKRQLTWLMKITDLKMNILNQNIKLMPSANVISELERLSASFTITTAHQKYCNLHLRQLYGVPLHLLSVWISPEKYTYFDFSLKENLVVISPDYHPEKEKILKLLEGIPELKLQIVKDMTYEAYKELISKAKWSITFGEGLDGYFIEPIFSGAIGFAVFNSDFFTDDFFNLTTVYHSYVSMTEKLVSTIQHLDSVDNFSICQRELFDLCAKHYSHDNYVHRLSDFYQKKYTYA